MSIDWKGTSYDSILVIVDRLIRWKDLSMNYVTELPISTDWKGTSYDSIVVIVDRLTKMVHYESVQITIDAPGHDRCTRAGGGNFRRCSSTPRSLRLSDQGSVFTHLSSAHSSSTHPSSTHPSSTHPSYDTWAPTPRRQVPPPLPSKPRLLVARTINHQLIIDTQSLLAVWWRSVIGDDLCGFHLGQTTAEAAVVDYDWSGVTLRTTARKGGLRLEWCNSTHHYSVATKRSLQLRWEVVAEETWLGWTQPGEVSQV